MKKLSSLTRFDMERMDREAYTRDELRREQREYRSDPPPTPKKGSK